eukprot:gene6499-10507_t
MSDSGGNLTPLSETTEENQILNVEEKELSREELLCQLEDSDFKIRGLERQLRDSKKKLKKINEVFKSDECRLNEVIENLTLKCSFYEKIIEELEPETNIQELREKVHAEVEKSKNFDKLSEVDYEIQRNNNLEEVLNQKNSPGVGYIKSNSLLFAPSPDSDEQPLSPKKSSKSVLNMFGLNEKIPLSPRLEKKNSANMGKKKEKMTEVFVVEDEDSDDEETEFSENDMNQMMQSDGEKKNKEVEFSEKIMNSLQVGIKVSMKNLKQNDFLIKQQNKQNFNFKSFGNDSFSSLRESAGVTEEEFIKSICEQNMKVIITPGKSGALLFFTADRKFVLKTVSVTERKFLEKILKNYEHHVKSRPSTTIVRLLALYKITINKASIQLIVMENVFPIKPKIVFDLKGSSIGRSATIEEKASGGILKDNDLLSSDLRIKIAENFKKEFLENLTEDCKFLANNEIMDYSMLLGIDEEPENEFEQTVKNRFTHLKSVEGNQHYYLGIIDILQKWNLKKKAEVQYKQTLLQNDKSKLSAMPPKDYANRFLNFLNESAIFGNENSTRNSPVQEWDYYFGNVLIYKPEFLKANLTDFPIRFTDLSTYGIGPGYKLGFVLQYEHPKTRKVFCDAVLSQQELTIKNGFSLIYENAIIWIGFTIFCISWVLLMIFSCICQFKDSSKLSFQYFRCGKQFRNIVGYDHEMYFNYSCFILVSIIFIFFVSFSTLILADLTSQYAFRYHGAYSALSISAVGSHDYIQEESVLEVCKLYDESKTSKLYSKAVRISHKINEINDKLENENDEKLIMKDQLISDLQKTRNDIQISQEKSKDYEKAIITFFHSNVVQNCLKQLPKELELFKAKKISYYEDDIIWFNHQKSYIEIGIKIAVSWFFSLIIIFSLIFVASLLFFFQIAIFGVRSIFNDFISILSSNGYTVFDYFPGSFFLVFPILEIINPI